VSALEKAARRKIDKYKDIAHQLGLAFKPFIVNVSGALHDDARNLMDWVAANADVPWHKLSWQTPPHSQGILAPEAQHCPP